jgi:hypothetical protein
MRKTLPVLLTLAALFGTPNAANCQSTSAALFTITGIVPAVRDLYVDEADNIIGIEISSDGMPFPESKIGVFRNGSRILLDDKIQQQYYSYLDHPEIAGIDWSAKHRHYYPINPQVLKDIQTKSPSILESGSNITLENGILYRTITVK